MVVPDMAPKQFRKPMLPPPPPHHNLPPHHRPPHRRPPPFPFLPPPHPPRMPPFCYRGRGRCPPGFRPRLPPPPMPPRPPPFMPPPSMMPPPPPPQQMFKVSKNQGPVHRRNAGGGKHRGSYEDFLTDMSQPWITPEIRHANKYKQQLGRIARESRGGGGEWWAMFKMQRAKCHDMIREARLAYLHYHNPMPPPPSQPLPDPDQDFTLDTVL